jgi:hypothetical protein
MTAASLHNNLSITKHTSLTLLPNTYIQLSIISPSEPSVLLLPTIIILNRISSTTSSCSSAQISREDAEGDATHSGENAMIARRSDYDTVKDPWNISLSWLSQ